ncbi:MAG TPA: excinuclease ABC subunit UvrC [Vicinamibacterales bacterium]|nr:excinuclease ABC subunit UvrC [Vicinamibacterales bacterium]
MPIRELKEQIARLPEQPGVYLYYNAAGETIYVGKARSLRDRVRSYLGAAGSSPKTDALLDEVSRLEVIVTDSVVEALALENHLIKQRVPRYNILLRDDKNYPYLQLTLGEPFPRVLVARRVERDGHYYAGPFLPASLARRTMSLTHRLFGIRSCNEVITGRRGRPCVEYDIHRCIAPCVETLCTPERYREAVEDTRLFLDGRNAELAGLLEVRMQAAAAGEHFEEAAHLRDAMRTVQALQDRQQKMAGTALGDRDVFGLTIGPAGALVQVFLVRGGRVVERIALGTDEQPIGGTERDVVQAALQQFYEGRTAPSEVHVPVEPDELDALEGWLGARAGRRVHIVVPRRGEKRGLIDLASRNAALAYRARFEQGPAAEAALERLRAALALPATPRRIECFDISTIQGSETVASMVVCENGRMRPAEYRKFRIKGTARQARRPASGSTGPATAPADRGAARDRAPLQAATPLSSGSGAPATAAGGADASRPHPEAEVRAPRGLHDDFAAMEEVVERRYRRVLDRGGPFPDLIVIDGGRGQLSSAYEALGRLGLANLVAVGLAKKEELVVTRDRAEPIALAVDDPALLLLERIRDEAHRFAVTFHRRARTLRDLQSELDAVPGIGPRRRRALLTRFGSLAGVRRATREELTTAVGARAADAVLAHFEER